MKDENTSKPQARVRMVPVTPEMRTYLESEAARRGTDVETIYLEEMAAKAELAKITPRNADLLRIADRFPAPQTWDDE